MISLLKEKGLYENALILYNSDHGDYMGYHHLLLKGSHMYEPLIRVPLIIKYPRQLQAGSVCDALVNTIDCAPTLLKQAGCDVPTTMPGLDLTATPQRELLFAESGRGNAYMVRSQTHKLLLCRDDSHSQYFDLQNDPHEQHSLYKDPAHQTEIAELKTALANWALFDAPYPVHSDEEAPIISAANAQPRTAEQREEIYAYFAGKMREKLEH
jgi:arylsulfatase A-like enzyme